MNDADEVLIENREGIAWLTLNRPQKANAMNISMMAALVDSLDRALDDSAIKALVVTGAGTRVFSGGVDVRSASELPPELREIALDAATLGDYVGKYRLGPGAIVDFTLRGDHLETQITGQPAFPVYASAEDKFFLKIVDAQLDFERDTGGKVVAVVLHQNGRDTRAPRVTTER